MSRIKVGFHLKLTFAIDLILRTTDYGYLQLDGGTPMEARVYNIIKLLALAYRLLGMPMIDEFHENADVFIFLISTLAGGTGLNLTGANKVVIFGAAIF